MSAIIKTEEHQLLQAAQDYNALNLSMAASIVWIVHDILLTLPQEIESVWRTKFTYHKILYIITRYFGLASLMYGSVNFVGSSSPSPSFLFCRHWLWFIGFGPAVSNATGELLFMIRIYAAYGRSRSSCVADHTPSRLVKADIASWSGCSIVGRCSPDGCTNNFNLLTSKHLTPLIVLFIRDGMAYFILISALIRLQGYYPEVTLPAAIIINLFMTETHMYFSRSLTSEPFTVIQAVSQLAKLRYIRGWLITYSPGRYTVPHVNATEHSKRPWRIIRNQYRLSGDNLEVYK
ncbi:hypothetical protein CERSUDRAFT_74094 [Gelatoporia subvermispora B]|uniref:DUF6533 domain-containing protein n=1 Tax=Ceriporiopsis subvermispora (strain B) TaxID=914234 RepID=M2RF67_CERS8|nr:hypothetical protein CERSUDRAFT_74094 [Gelatoporia subvermispora B]